jgi:hypothetical protein
VSKRFTYSPIGFGENLTSLLDLLQALRFALRWRNIEQRLELGTKVHSLGGAGGEVPLDPFGLFFPSHHVHSAKSHIGKKATPANAHERGDRHRS